MVIKVKLLQEFLKFIDNQDGYIEDLFRTDDAGNKLIKLLGEEKSRNFRVIIAHKSHSLVCFWLLDEKDNNKDKPIAWLDSEGWPNAVFARNLEEFLSLIPYGSGTIYDIISSWLYFKEDPDTVASPLKRFDKAYLEEQLEIAKNSNDGCQEYINWLNKAKIEICKDAVRLIGDSINKYSHFSDQINGQ